jgi:starch-binding outer membrane protein, SusD/RagB family
MHAYPAGARTRAAAGALALAALVGCSEFLAVDNPNVIDVGAIDPVADATTLANSAQQNFSVAHGFLVTWGGWFTGEAEVSETFPTRNDVGRRDVQQSNGSLNGEVWTPLGLAAASTKIVLDLDLPNPTTNLNYAKSALWRGYSFVMMAESFCTGTVESGPELTTAHMLDSAVANFTNAMTIGAAAANAEGTTIANTARVGRARAHLQAGRKTEAAADASAVPAGFVYSLPYVDDLTNRARLSNRMFQFTQDRGSISVSPAFRVADPRIQFKGPGEHNLTPQDPSSGPFYIQQKYPNYASSVRLASRLEADYIAAEAGSVTAQLALINARRGANGQPAYAGSQAAGAVLTELMWQKSLDFWLEGQRIGDMRRNPNNMTALPVPGSVYFKPGFAPVSNGTCYPLPLAERDNNPNLGQ